MADTNHTERAHALLSASGSSRWLNCTPSPRMEEQFEDSNSVFAAEGTLAHEFADLALQLHFKQITKRKYNAEVKKLKKDELHTKSMDQYVDDYVTYCIEQFNERTKEHGDVDAMIEQRLDFSKWVKDGFGTGDFGIGGDGFIDVIDLKYGKGVRVNAEDNSQLKLYGLGALQAHDLLYDIHTIRLTIVQPRLNHVSSWDISKTDLLDWANDTVTPAAELAFEGLGETVVGDWCRWCKAKPRCKALHDHTINIAKNVFDDIALPDDPRFVSDAELLDIRSKSKLATDYINSVNAHILKEALAGKQWDGLKVVAGRANRKWSDAAEVEKRLLEKGYTLDQIKESKLKGIGKISDLMSVDEWDDSIKDLVVKPQGKPTLVYATDPRPSIGGNDEAKRIFE